MEAADLTGVPRRAIFGPINYRPLKKLGSPGAIAVKTKHRKGLARIRVASQAQLRAVEKLLDPKVMKIPETGYAGSES